MGDGRNKSNDGVDQVIPLLKLRHSDFHRIEPIQLELHSAPVTADGNIVTILYDVGE